MVNSTVISPDDRLPTIATQAPAKGEKWFALGLILGLILISISISQVFSFVHTVRIGAFVPAYATALFLCDTITAFLLYAQFTIIRSRALLLISTAYVFNALILIVWMLTLPGGVAQQGVLGGIQTTTYLYIVWHIGFPAFVVAYAILKAEKQSNVSLDWNFTSVGVEIVLSIGSCILVVAAISTIIIHFDYILPALNVNAMHLSSAWLYVVILIIAFHGIALISLWSKRSSILDLWLMVVLCAYIAEICLITFPNSDRYTIGWYSGRVCALFASGLILFILLYDTTLLHSHLLRARLAHRREHNARLLTGVSISAAIAHEIKQPLASIIANAQAGKRLLKKSVPELEEVAEAFKDIVSAGEQADAVIASVRAMFSASPSTHKISLDINQLIDEALTLLRAELQRHRILVQNERNYRLLPVKVDHVQLRQVLLNLMTNAIDSMSDIDGPRILSVESQAGPNGGVTIIVADNGRGIAEKDLASIFDPFFTTKPNGMGMGLTLCRSIVEAHDGKLWAAPAAPRGAVFQIYLSCG